MTPVGEQAPVRPRAGYTSPECRAAVDWPEGHRLCSGNQQTLVGTAVAERLRCACTCHQEARR